MPQYGLLCKIFELMKREEILASDNPQSFNFLLGIQDLNTRITEAGQLGSGSPATRKYYIPLPFCEFLTQGAIPGQKVFPIQAIKMPIYLELDIDQPNNILESTASSGLDWDLTNVELIVSQIADQNLSNLVLNENSGTPINIPFRTWTNNIFTLTGSTLNANIESRYQSLDMVVAVMRNQADITDPTVLDRFSTYNLNDLTELQWQLGSSLYPQRPLTEPIELLYNIMKDVDRFHFSDPLYREQMIGSSIETDKAILINNFEKYSDDNTHIIDGVATDSNTSNLLMRLRLSGAPAVTQEITCFTQHSCIVKVLNGNITLLQ
jgi:hypothetical protein